MPPTNLRPCPTASDFSIPCPGCSGGARAVAYCAPGPQPYRQSASREAVPPAQEW